MLELRDFDEDRNSSRFVHLTALSDDKPGEVEDEFIPPRKIKPIAIQSGDKECTFTLEMVPNKFVNKVLTQYWDEEAGAADKNRTRVVDSVTKVNPEASKVDVILKDLKPNTVYGMRFHPVTDYGKGPASDTAHVDSPKITTKCATLPSSPPKNIKLTESSSVSALFVWEKPETMAPHVVMDRYTYQVKNLDVKNNDEWGKHTDEEKL